MQFSKPLYEPQWVEPHKQDLRDPSTFREYDVLQEFDVECDCGNRYRAVRRDRRPGARGVGRFVIVGSTIELTCPTARCVVKNAGFAIDWND